MGLKHIFAGSMTQLQHRSTNKQKGKTMTPNALHKQLILAALAILLAAPLAQAENFTLTSKDLGGQLSDQQVFSGFGCTGKNISPQLLWKNAPVDTKSFAITVYDPDAPTGSGWWHWVVFNIPATVTQLAADAGNPSKDLAPKGSIQSVTDYGKPGFGGACPPVGDKPHRYIFTVYALKVEKLELDNTSPPAMVGYYLNQNALAKASLISYYGR
jgi:Raf kinase inhibitor-like YbhB/YbcL family protein